MTHTSQNRQNVLYHIVCAAPPAQKVAQAVSLAQSSGWDVCILATPQAVDFLDVSLLEDLTHHPVRSTYKTIGDDDVLPKVNAMVVAPMTLNTTTKWAQGHADTLALSQLCKGLGLHLPIVAAPCITTAYANHPAFPTSVDILRTCGVHVLYDPENYPAPHIVPWEQIIHELNMIVDEHEHEHDHSKIK